MDGNDNAPLPPPAGDLAPDKPKSPGKTLKLPPLSASSTTALPDISQSMSPAHFVSDSLKASTGLISGAAEQLNNSVHSGFDLLSEAADGLKDVSAATIEASKKEIRHYMSPEELNDKIYTDKHHFAAIRLQSCIRGLMVRRRLASSHRPQLELFQMSKKLYFECGRCIPEKAGGKSETGLPRLAGPDLPKIRRILETYPNLDLLQPHFPDGLTVFHKAAQRGYYELVEDLLIHWLEHAVPSTFSPVDIKALRGVFKMVLDVKRRRELVQDNIPITRELKRLKLPVDAITHKIDRIEDEIISFEQFMSAIGNPLVTQRDNRGNSALHFAAEGGYKALCHLLLEHGANIDAQNYSGETP